MSVNRASCKKTFFYFEFLEWASYNTILSHIANVKECTHYFCKRFNRKGHQ